MIKMELLKPETTDAAEVVRFQCKDCGDIVNSMRILAHAKEAHRTNVVDVNASIRGWGRPKNQYRRKSNID